MASINIYVTDDLKERMSHVAANWSEVCRRAIEAELNRSTGDEQPTLGTPQDIEDWKQIAFDQNLLAQGIVIKPSMAPNYSGSTPKGVTDLSGWLDDINKAIGPTGVGGARISQLLEGSYPAGILIPGRPWLSGRLKLEQKLIFNYPPTEESI
ncbi:MAG: hypothetical protein KME45_30850 [Stenomitos rutilans HA7619-LM2]|jgi:hypothetical protein|nr:hypothetical protein [Stenomitos rutilans HA7619-LM2]